MSKARPVFPGATLFSTRRVHKRQLLLRPSKQVNQVILYVVAVLAERYNILLHALCFMSNHAHDVATDPDGRIVEFQRDCHALIARHVNAMFGEFESMWSREPTCRVECAEAADILDKITYTMCNPVEGLLVSRGHHWPGVRRAWPAKPITIHRPPGFFRNAERGGCWPDEITLTLSRPPGLEDLSDSELSDCLRNATEEREARVRDAAQSRGQQFLGRRAVLRQPRHSHPTTREKRFGLRPTVAGKSIWTRIERLRQRTGWLTEYNQARDAFRDGQRDVLFPYGTFKLRRYYRVASHPREGANSDKLTTANIASFG
jgi:putative transposase